MKLCIQGEKKEKTMNEEPYKTKAVYLDSFASHGIPTGIPFAAAREESVS
jgi:hypothetical protein